MARQRSLARCPGSIQFDGIVLGKESWLADCERLYMVHCHSVDTYVWQKASATLFCSTASMWVLPAKHCWPLARTRPKRRSSIVIGIGIGSRSQKEEQALGLFVWDTITIGPWQILLSCFSFVAGNGLCGALSWGRKPSKIAATDKN